MSNVVNFVSRKHFKEEENRIQLKDLSINTILDKFRFELFAFEKSEGTLKQYLSIVKQYLTFIGVKSSLDLYKMEEYELFAKYVANCKKEGLSSVTINNRRATLISFSNFLVRNNMIQYNVIASSTRLSEPKKAVTSLTEEQIQELLNVMLDKAINKQHRRKADHINAYREYVMTVLLCMSGIRIKECIDIKIGDIDFKNKNIGIRGKGYNGQISRTIFLSDDVMKLLNNWMTLRDNIETDYSEDTLFISALTRKKITINSLELRFIEVSKELGFRVHPHILRHSFATNNLHNNRMSLNELSDVLGHRDIVITSSTYVGADLSAFKKMSTLDNYTIYLNEF